MLGHSSSSIYQANKSARACFITSSIRLMGNTLPFELTKEAFKGSVVAAMPDCALLQTNVLRFRKRW